MAAAGYRVRPLCLYRNTAYLTAGQLKRGYAQTPEQVQERVGVTLRLFLELCAHVDEPPLIVPYEACAARPEFRVGLFTFLGLPEPTGEFYNANEAYEELPALPW